MAKENLGHEEIKDRIISIGRKLGFISEEEYHIGDYRVDVVWKQMQDADPSHAFEVVATKSNANMNRALANLNAAIGSWKGVQLFIVTPEENKQKIKERISESFRGIEKVLRIMTPEDAIKLFNELESVCLLGRKFGLRIRAVKKLKTQTEH